MPREATALQVHVVLTPEQLAQVFSEFSHDEQAKFFVALGRAAAVWNEPGASMQWFYVGKYLREHDDAQIGGRVVSDIAAGLGE